jgi:predicted HAD superfamily phosphohydrolase YqeG
MYKANKPSPKNYRIAMENMNTTVDNTIFVGDQIFTDVWGANRAGIRSVMVKPVLKWKEEIQIILKRFIEALVMIPYPLYEKKGNCKKVPLIQKNVEKDGEA